MKRILIPFSLLLILFLFQGQTAFAGLDQSVQSQLGDDNISVSIREIDSGELLYGKNADVPMKPASTLKLLTASAALEMLGPEYRFQTSLYTHGEVEGKVLNGDVYIKGGGDPTLQKKDFIMMASVLKHAGIEKVNGNLHGDDTFFSGAPLTPGISKEDESYYFASRISALTMSPDQDYDAGTIIVHVNATKVGARPHIAVEPGTAGMAIHNQAATVRGSQENTIEILREHGTNKITVTGQIPINTAFKDWVTLNDPTVNTLQMIKDEFEEFGIRFSPTYEIQRNKVPKDAQLLYKKRSLPLEALVVPFLKLSNNSIADILVKTMGREINGKGDTAEGINALNEFGFSLGLDMDRWKLEDGSGMSPNNRATANQLSLLLSRMNVQPNFLLLYKSLPVGGHKDRLIGGSLKKRFHNERYKNRVIAKTGHISGVYTLAGYLHANSGITYSFAIMTQNQESARLSAIDHVVEQIIETY